MTGLYVHGQSKLHQMRPSHKLLGLFMIGALLITVEQGFAVGLAALVIGTIFVSVAKLGLGRLWQSTRPLLVWFLIIFVAQVWLADVSAAILVMLRILALVWAAALVTYTTRLTDMSDALATLFGFLRPFGVSPERIAFLCALTIRLVPAVFETLNEVREAQRARGIERAYIATFVPVIIRVLKQADTMSDALIARGFDRWDEVK